MLLFDVLPTLNRALNTNEIASVGLLVAQELLDWHEKNGAHRDISHSTIELEKNGTVKLIAQKDTAKDPDFPSPEYESSKKQTKEGDIFSLGASLFNAADFGLEDDEEPDIREDLNDIIEKMTEDEPQDRLPLPEVIKSLKVITKGDEVAILKNTLDEVWLKRHKEERKAQEEKERERKDSARKDREALELAEQRIAEEKKAQELQIIREAQEQQRLQAIEQQRIRPIKSKEKLEPIKERKSQDGSEDSPKQKRERNNTKVEAKIVKKESAAHSHSSDSEERNIVSQKSVKVDQPKKANNTLEKKERSNTNNKALDKVKHGGSESKETTPNPVPRANEKKPPEKKTITYREIS